MERIKSGLLKNAHMLRCAASLCVAAYAQKFASLLGLCAPRLWTFLSSPVKKNPLSKPLAYICFLLLISVFLASCSLPSPYLQKEPAKGIYHRVKKGETFQGIARAYRIKMQDLAEVNNIDNPGLIKEGSVVFIPDVNQVIDDVMTSARKTDAESKAATRADKAVRIKSSLENDRGKDVRVANEASKTIPSEDASPAESPAAGTPSDEKSEHKSKSDAEEKEKIQFDKKRFIWPVEKYTVKTSFGIQPNKTYHNWIKIVAVAGTQVKAAAAGIVIFSGPLKDYGETIILRHENSYATVYTHLKKRYVKTDQKIKKGESIATVGEKDEAGDTYMNFEVRLHGKARNPLFFLP
jgi:lipoprotein NlpD